MTTIEFRARCQACETQRVIIGPFHVRNPAELDAAEHAMTGVNVRARCPTCDAVECVAMFVDGVRVEEWTDADEYERTSGPTAGPLPPKPWPDTN